MWVTFMAAVKKSILCFVAIVAIADGQFSVLGRCSEEKLEIWRIHETAFICHLQSSNISLKIVINAGKIRAKCSEKANFTTEVTTSGLQLFDGAKIQLLSLNSCPDSIFNGLVFRNETVVDTLELKNVDRKVIVPTHHFSHLNLRRLVLQSIRSFAFENGRQNFLSRLEELALWKIKGQSRLPQNIPSNLRVLEARWWHRGLENFDVSSLPNLVKLDFSGTKMAKLTANVFVANEHVETLLLNATGMKNIDKEAFNGLSRLRFLDLSETMLDFVPVRLFEPVRNIEAVVWLEDLAPGQRIFPPHMFSRNNSNLVSFEYSRAERGPVLINSSAFGAPLKMQTLRLSKTLMSRYDLIVNLVAKMDNLRRLHIDANNLEELRPGDVPRNVAELKIGDNPFGCDCPTLYTVRSLRNVTLDGSHVAFTCEDNSTVNVDGIGFETKLIECARWSYSQMALVVSVAVTCTLLTLALGFGAIWRKRVWLYHEGIWQFCFREESVSESNEKEIHGDDCQYDVFVSYCNDDVEIAEHVYTILRADPHGDHGRTYRCALHTVDFNPGVSITSNIDKFTRASRKTVALVSDAYIDAPFCRVEFELALSLGKLIVILLVESHKNLARLDSYEPLRTYVETRTYLRYGGPNFWPRLLYALPHKRRKIRAKQKRSEAIEMM